MASVPRPRPLAALLAALALAALVAGCGTSFKVPTESRTGRTQPGKGTYQLYDTWTQMPNVKDVLLTPSGELFILFQDDVTKTGRVERYPQSKPQSAPHPTPFSARFDGLVNPTAICFGANRLFVLDQGDSSVARITQPSDRLYFAEANADLDTNVTTIRGFARPIRLLQEADTTVTPRRERLADLSSYWHVREYLLDGTYVGSFTDTSFAYVTGIAADAQGRVYVGGTIMYCRVDPFSSQTRSLEYRYRIRRYVQGAPDPRYWRFVLDGAWHKDLTYRLLEGTGFGATNDPQGMQWADPPWSDAGPVGPGIYFADRGNDQVQKYADPAGMAQSFKLDIGGSGPDSMLLSRPVDVAVDSAGFVYMVDGGHQRVLRYDSDGRFFQRVDRNPDEPAMPLVQPTGVAADNRQVYVVDRGNGQVLRFWRRD